LESLPDLAGGGGPRREVGAAKVSFHLRAWEKESTPEFEVRARINFPLGRDEEKNGACGGISLVLKQAEKNKTGYKNLGFCKKTCRGRTVPSFYYLGDSRREEAERGKGKTIISGLAGMRGNAVKLIRGRREDEKKTGQGLGGY